MLDDITLTKHALLLADSVRGIYGPQHAARELAEFLPASGISAEDIYILTIEGPDHEHYWDAWQSLTETIIVDDTGKRWMILESEGDIWLDIADYMPRWCH